MGSIANGAGRAIVNARSLGECEDEARSLGYDGIDVARVPGTREFRAISYNANGYRAEALGRSEVHAARSLVRTLKLR